MELKLEDTLLLQSYVDSKFSTKDNYVELIIRPECNQQCEYCYLHQHGNEIYPSNIRKTNEEILNNVSLLINYFIEKQYIISKLELFAGDLFYDNLFFDLIEIIYNYYNFININKLLESSKIIIPCNMSFCKYDDKIEKVKTLISRFKDINVDLIFSYSTDGLYGINTREKENLTEQDFDKILSLCHTYGWTVHPMISPENIDNAYKNYDWWKQKLILFPNLFSTIYPNFLEVRNNNWTDEQIEKYQDFLNYILRDIYHNFYKDDSMKFIWKEFQHYDYIDENNHKLNAKNMSIIRVPPIDKFYNSPMCNLGNLDLCINCLNLSIVPCHRMAYPMWSGGHFEIQDNKIIDLIANENINGYLNLTTLNDKNKPGCINCLYKNICMRGCIGSQFETFAEPYFPIPQVCKLLQVKYNTIIQFYHKKSIFHWMFNCDPTYPNNAIWRDLLIKLGYTEYQRFKFNE